MENLRFETFGTIVIADVIASFAGFVTRNAFVVDVDEAVSDVAFRRNNHARTGLQLITIRACSTVSIGGIFAGFA